ncbi:MAG TPA: winged helix-turn-helix domain-containing protein, partial [Thermoanaerobaculia bacterium]|nr:winged helix-turn-helix domain-containing protein [Thermoanaerobaculia bacterium]
DTNVVDVAIRRLRQKVDDPFERKLIHTVRGVEYVLREWRCATSSRSSRPSCSGLRRRAF